MAARQQLCFTRGSTQDEVACVQGTPWMIDGGSRETWHYGRSEVSFDAQRRVSAWANRDRCLRVVYATSASAAYAALVAEREAALAELARAHELASERAAASSVVGAERDSALAELVVVRAELGAALAERDAARTELVRVRAALGAALPERDAALSERGAALAELDAALAEQVRARPLAAERDAARTELVRVRAERGAVTAERDATRTELARVRGERAAALSKAAAAREQLVDAQLALGDLGAAPPPDARRGECCWPFDAGSRRDGCCWPSDAGSLRDMCSGGPARARAPALVSYSFAPLAPTFEPADLAALRRAAAAPAPGGRGPAALVIEHALHSVVRSALAGSLGAARRSLSVGFGLGKLAAMCPRGALAWERDWSRPAREQDWASLAATATALLAELGLAPPPPA